MTNSLIKAVFVAVAIAAPTGAFAASYDGMAPGATPVSTHSASVDHTGDRSKSNAERTDKDRVHGERKSEMPSAPLDNPYTHWDANTNAG